MEKPQEVFVDAVSWFNITGKILLLLLWGYFTFQLLSSPKPWILLDGVNLVIHETGHFLFMFAGQFIYILAGSVVQTLVPILLIIYFLIREEYFSSAALLFWLGDSLINVSVYIKDAQAMAMPLITGEIHDWNWLLTKTGHLQQDQFIGGFVYLLGIICVVSSLGLITIMVGLNIVNKVRT